ncbi:DUF6146 family protein [Pontimicrobium sp. SW4]|uniref:DUF6146 family protein n=1 Tax=Pontimicrobium sp. SW4 TaxID=3153519 RepID=A0AAU7BXG7_9FLAO
MKNTLLILLICFGVISCKTSKKVNSNKEISTIEQDTIRIANDELEYEIIIIEPGFNTWLLSTAKPEGYYSQQFLETRNQLFVSEWNSRVLQPHRYNPSLYEMQIDYQPNINYGYEVNYKLYNYFIYFQLNYKQQLTGFTPRI